VGGGGGGERLVKACADGVLGLVCVRVWARLAGGIASLVDFLAKGGAMVSCFWPICVRWQCYRFLGVCGGVGVCVVGS